MQNLTTTYLSKFLLISAFTLGLSGCSQVAHTTRQALSDTVAKTYGFKSRIVKGGNFWLQAYEHVKDPNAPYYVYIEGDGFAFKNKYSISENPTPNRSVTLDLAVRDNRPNVVYLARPCQYSSFALDKHCHHSYWTEKRMGEEVVAGINDAIIRVTNNQSVHLVGYSGGGGIAVLVAARNPKVASILTVAANLDHIAFNHYHHTRPMLGSLNPIDYVAKVSNIPQLHLSGGQDKTIPVFMADKFVQAAHSPCVKQEVMPKATHTLGWRENWQYIIKSSITCNYDRQAGHAGIVGK